MNGTPPQRRRQAETEDAPSPGRPARRWPLIAALAGVLGVASWRVVAPAPPVPVDAMMASSGWADERRCIDCHDQAKEFQLTGHANSLHRATEPELLTLAQALTESPEAQAEGMRIELRDGVPLAVHEREGIERTARLDWCFGSGAHARTWMALLGDSWGATDALEFRWTWYPHADRFDVTPGQPEDMSASYLGGLGMLYDYPKTRRCFGCHATRVAEDHGRLREDSLSAGVNCQRCHGPRGRHVATEKADPNWSWRDLDQDESVHRCAECHRGATEQTPEEIRPDNVQIARFQPVGLVQAPCYRKSGTLTCVSCHDPHTPVELQDSLGDWQCTQCHDGTAELRPHCGAGFGDDCLKCHMPKVQWSPTLQFTDHWIRVRERSEAGP